MKKNKKFTIVLWSLILITILTTAVWFSFKGIGKKPDNVAANDSSRIHSHTLVVDGITVVKLSEEELENSGITLVKLDKVSNLAQLTVYGSVVSIQDLSKDVQNFETAKAQLAKSKENLLLSQQNYKRVKSLYEKKLASEQDFQSAQAAFLSDQADVNSSSSNLNSQKSSILEQWGDELSGWIFNGSTKLQRLLSLDNALVQISLPTNENIKIPPKIYIESPIENRKLISCSFLSAGYLANSQFQTKTLYYIATAPALSGGMNVKAFLPIGKNLYGVVVPSSSIIWYQGKSWIYSEKSPNEFIRVEIDVNNPVDDGFFVAEDKGIIAPGVTVVKNGAQLLLSEEFTPAQSSQTEEGDND